MSGNEGATMSRAEAAAAVQHTVGGWLGVVHQSDALTPDEKQAKADALMALYLWAASRR